MKCVGECWARSGARWCSMESRDFHSDVENRRLTMTVQRQDLQEHDHPGANPVRGDLSIEPVAPNQGQTPLRVTWSMGTVLSGLDSFSLRRFNRGEGRSGKNQEWGQDPFVLQVTPSRVRPISACVRFYKQVTPNAVKRQCLVGSPGRVVGRISAWFCILALLGLVGCTLAPRYQRPVAPVAQEWPSGPAYGSDQTNRVGITSAADYGWREFFGDPRLQKLLELALANNRDLRVAALNVEQARAQYRIARSALFPTIDAVGTGSRQRLPGGFLGEGGSLTYSQYSVGLGVTAYELDLFGRVRSLKSQALENYFVTEEGRRSAHLALLAQVAIQYLAERQFDEGLTITRKTLESVTNYYDLIQKTFEIGNASELDLRSAEAQVQSARASVASYQRQQAQAQNALVLLVGQPLPSDLPPPQPLGSQRFLSDLSPGLPSDLLQRRPDILAAEHQLKAANANIGAARAAFFPKITLTGSAGTASAQLGDLFAPGSAAWSYSPQITLPIFDAGNNLANLKAANVGKRIEIAQYEKSIQSAFREVADALAARATLEAEIQAEEALVKAEEKRYSLAGVLYRNGAENYLTVLTAQQDLYSAQQRLLQSHFARLANLISLYKALGGGWHEHTATGQEVRAGS